MQVELVSRLKEFVLEGTTLLTLVMACVALLLIEFWGVMKIWKIVRGRHAGKP